MRISQSPERNGLHHRMASIVLVTILATLAVAIYPFSQTNSAIAQEFQQPITVTIDKSALCSGSWRIWSYCYEQRYWRRSKRLLY